MSFKAPLPELASLKVVLPSGLTDISGRTAANAGAFPLTMNTGGMPPAGEVRYSAPRRH